MKNLFFKTLAEGIIEDIYKVEIKREACEYYGGITFLEVFNKNNGRISKLEITRDEAEMLDFIINHQKNIVENNPSIEMR